jgi:hypothetical protein
MTTSIKLTEDEFDSQYPLVRNHLNPNASWAFDDNRGCLFEIYGKELEFVRQQHPRTIWTLTESADGEDYQFVQSGYHLVNRIGYLISTVPVPDNTVIEVRIPMESDEDPAENG